MPEFGELLRKYRQSCKDPLTARQLSQERFGELLGTELGLLAGYSGAAVSDWERGKSKIHADERRLLVGLVRVLFTNGGLETIPAADVLFEVGNYRPLNLGEKRQVFPNELLEAQDVSKNPEKQLGLGALLQERVFYGVDGAALRARLADAQAGPAPAWPRKVVTLLNWSSSRWSIYRSVRALVWIWVWVLSCWLILPSLRWPFPGQQDALAAMILYAGGTLSIPMLVGLLTDTKNDRFWQEHHLATDQAIRLYTYQGASIGFQVSYAILLVVNLVLYYLGLRPGLWFELIEMTFPLIVSYMSGWLVPYNMWRAYGRLNLADGAIFFIFPISGPLWGAFFYSYGSVLLSADFAGAITILLAASLFVGTLAWQYSRAGTTVIPISWWVAFWGLVLVLSLITTANDLFGVTALAGIIITLVTILALGRIRLTLAGMIGFTIIIGVSWMALLFNAWAGRVIFIALLAIWWRWGQKYLAFPMSFWGVLIALVACAWIRQLGWLSDLQVSTAFLVAVLLLLFGEWRLGLPTHQPG